MGEWKKNTKLMQVDKACVGKAFQSKLKTKKYFI
jgi:hypothetical protein